jgi:hypothetical protein
MKKRNIFIFLCLLSALALGAFLQFVPNMAVAAEATFLPPDPDPVPFYEGMGKFVRGGRNVEAYKYIHSEGYPPFPDRVKFISTLTGSWHQMGVQYARRSGDATRCVSDIWWKAECVMFGKAETLKAMKLYEAQIAALDPNLVDFMRGIAEGAEPWLSQSIYADKNHPLYATAYERIMAVNIWDEWAMIHPSKFPDGSSTFGGTKKAPPVTGMVGCSAFAARGKATVDGRTIAAHNRHSPYNPRDYAQAFITKPPKGMGNICWVLSNCPQVAANQVVNEKGLSIILLFGGVSNPKSWQHPGGPYFAEGFGVPWFHLFLYVGTHANNAEEAIEMLTRGTPEYRAKTGRNSLLLGGGWIFLVADNETLAVVEATADRYAVRYPGEFTPGWESKDYIVSTNHFLCDFSYDKDNNRTDVPMSIFNVVPMSDIRLWTMLWDMKHRYGRIDRYMAQRILGGLYAYDKDTGERIDCAERGGKWHIYGEVKACNTGTGVGLRGGSDDSKVAVLDENKSAVYWTMGNASDWEGAWDAFYFGEK